MLKEEFGINYLHDILFECNIEKYYNNQKELNSIGIERIISAFKTKIPKDDILKFVCAILAHKAYSSNFNIENKQIENFITKNYDTLIKTIDDIPDQINNLQDNNIEYIKNIFDQSCSLKLINYILYFATPKYKFFKKHNYGIQYFLLYMGLLNFKVFDKWFNKTRRIDLKIIYVYSLLFFLHHESFLTDESLTSNSVLLRMIRALAKYPLLKNNITVDKKFDIKNIIYEKIQKIEQLYLFVLYVGNTYRGQYYKDFYNESNFKQLICFFDENKFKNELTIDVFKDLYYKFYSSEIWRLIISKIHNNDNKINIQKFFLKCLIDELENQNLIINETFIEKANTVGYLLIPLSREYKDIEHIFNKTLIEVSMPYLYFRNYNRWTKLIAKLVFYLISFKIYCTIQKEDEKLKLYIEKFETVKRELMYYENENKINQILVFLKDFSLKLY